MQASTKVSALSLVISIAALAFSAMRCEPITADWMAILVGVLAALATIIIGWQIYALIDIRNLRNEYSKSFEQATLANERHQVIMCQALSDYFYNSVMGEEPFSDLYYLLYYKAATLMHASHINNPGFCETLIRSVNEMLVSPKEFYLSSSEKGHILDLLLQVHKGSHMAGFSDLLAKISSISVED